MKASFLYWSATLFTLTASSVGATVLYATRNYFDNSILELENKIFSKFKAAENKFFTKLRKEIISEIYKTPSKEGTDFFIKKKNSSEGDSDSAGSKSSSGTSTQETDEQKINKEFLNLINGNIEGFLTAFTFYQWDIKSENINKNLLKMKDQFFVSSLYFLQFIFSDLDKLLKEIEAYVDKNKSTSGWKFMLNDKYYTFLSELFDAGKEIFWLIKELSERTDLIKTENKLSDYSNFMLFDESGTDADITPNISGVIGKIENLIKDIDFSNKKDSFKNFYEDFVFSNPTEKKPENEKSQAKK